MSLWHTTPIPYWIALSTLLSALHPPTAPASLLSVAPFAYGVMRKVRPLLALAVALQLPALVALSLEQSLVRASLLMLTSLYLVELGDLVAKAGRARDMGFVRRKATQVTMVVAFALPVTAVVTAAAEHLSIVLDFGLAVLVLAILVLQALSLRVRP